MLSWCLYKRIFALCHPLISSHKHNVQIEHTHIFGAEILLYTMGTKRVSPMNFSIGWLRKQSMKVKIFLGALLAVSAVVAIKFTIEDPILIFFASETIQLVGIIVLLYKLFTYKTCSGLSLKTQEFTALFLVIRLSCSTIMGHNIHTVLDVISLVSTLLVIWMIRFKLKSSYINDLDNLQLSFVVVPCAIIAILIHPYTSHFRLVRMFWAFSMYLEAVSVLPQLRLMQNAKIIETFTGYYVFALGVSRFLGLANWIIRIYETRGSFLFLDEGGYFWFWAAFISETVQSFILADFCYYYIKSFMQGQLLRRMPI